MLGLVLAPVLAPVLASLRSSLARAFGADCLGFVLAPVLASLRSSLARAFGAECSGPAEFMQAVVVDAEMMADLVNDRDGHLVDDVVLGVTDVEQRLAVDRDGVG